MELTLWLFSPVWWGRFLMWAYWCPMSFRGWRCNGDCLSSLMHGCDWKSGSEYGAVSSRTVVDEFRGVPSKVVTCGRNTYKRSVYDHSFQHMCHWDGFVDLHSWVFMARYVQLNMQMLAESLIILPLWSILNLTWGMDYRMSIPFVR